MKGLMAAVLIGFVILLAGEGSAAARAPRGKVPRTSKIGYRRLPKRKRLPAPRGDQATPPTATDNSGLRRLSPVNPTTGKSPARLAPPAPDSPIQITGLDDFILTPPTSIPGRATGSEVFHISGNFPAGAIVKYECSRFKGIDGQPDTHGSGPEIIPPMAGAIECTFVVNVDVGLDDRRGPCRAKVMVTVLTLQ